MKCLKFSLPLLFLWLAALPTANSQTVTGSLTGVVTDPGGAVIVGAPVEIVNSVNKETRDATTNGSGLFQFTSITPGTYTLTIKQPGFKSYTQQNIIVGTSEKVDVHTISLQVGDVSTSIEVQAEAAHVQTDTSDRSLDVNLKQIQDTPIRGRNYQAIIKDMAGVQDLNSYDTRGWGAGSPTINGGQQGQVLVTLDGVAAQDSGAPGLNTYQAPSTDAVAEVRLLVSNYAAEFGSRAGGQENVSIKSGTPQFHGSAYYYWRHEELNANEWNNNATGAAKSKYRYQNPGGTIGGPLVIPFVRFNKNRDKLFFFFSYDYLHNINTTAISNYNMPTALEKLGDFSKSVSTASGNPVILIKDPTAAIAGTTYASENLPGSVSLAGTVCQAGNAASCNFIPASKLNPLGISMLNLFPTGAATDISGNHTYNYRFSGSNSNPRIDKILRVDYNISSKNTWFVRLLQDWQDQAGYGAILGAAGDGWGQFPHSYHIPSAGIATTFVHTFTPNLVNETVWGINKAHQENSPTDTNLYNASLLNSNKQFVAPATVNGAVNAGQALNVPTLLSENVNTLNLKPNVQFGFPSSVSAGSATGSLPGNLPSYGFDSRWPFDGTDSLQNFTNNITWIKGPHTFKAGFYYEHDARNVSIYSQYNTAGTYYFGSDSTNPIDTGYPYANAAAGSLFGYGQDNVKQTNRARYKQYEWFIQDTWKVTRRVTLDYGIRFQLLGPLYTANQRLGIFQASAYNASASGKLFQTVCVNSAGLPLLDASGNPARGTCATANKRAFDPATGVIKPLGFVGTFDPTTYTGLPYSGIVSYNGNFWNNPGVQYNPRLGVAWDIFGDGKTAFRAGVGIFHGRYTGVDTIGASGVGIGPQAAPPNFIAPFVGDLTIGQLATNTSAVFTPLTVVSGSQNFKPPSTYDWSAGVQHDFGHGYILDVSYVGYVSHNGFSQTAYDANAVQPYTTWSPNVPGCNLSLPGTCYVSKYLDPTSGAVGSQTPYANANVIRALAGGYQSFAQIQTYTQKGEAYYDALQLQFNKRVGGRFQYGVNYTWSKTITYTPHQFIPDYLTKNVASGVRPHTANFNLTYAVPDGSRLWKNAFTTEALDGWHIAAIGTLYSGNPLTVGCAYPSNANTNWWTGTPTNATSLNGISTLVFRCQQTGPLFLASGSTPSAAGSQVDPRLWYDINPASFTLPSMTSLGIGNTPPTEFWGNGVINVDLNVYKDFKLGGERRTLQIKAEAFNAFNHFNPGDPNTTLTFNYNTCTNNGGVLSNCQTTTSGSANLFGATPYTTAPAVQARHMILSARFSF